MGVMKRMGDNRAAVRRYNAAVRRAEKLSGADSSRLIRLETISEVERYEMAKDPDRAVAYNQAVEDWYNAVANQLRTTVAARSSRVARELKPKGYKDNYGLIYRIGFSFPRHGIYIHKGAGRGQGGYIGSSWTKLQRINGIEVSTGILRHTNPESLGGKQGTGNRRAFEWFDPIIRAQLPKLADIVTDYFDTMILDASRIYIDR